MNVFVWLIITKVLSVIGAVLNTLGFSSFFFFESLRSYGWWLVGAGFALILIGETTHYLLAKKIRKDSAVSVRKPS